MEDKNLPKVEKTGWPKNKKIQTEESHIWYKIDQPQHYYYLTVAYLFLLRLRRVTKINSKSRPINFMNDLYVPS